MARCRGAAAEALLMLAAFAVPLSATPAQGSSRDYFASAANRGTSMAGVAVRRLEARNGNPSALTAVRSLMFEAGMSRLPQLGLSYGHAGMAVRLGSNFSVGGDLASRRFDDLLTDEVAQGETGLEVSDRGARLMAAGELGALRIGVGYEYLERSLFAYNASEQWFTLGAAMSAGPVDIGVAHGFAPRPVLWRSHAGQAVEETFPATTAGVSLVRTYGHVAVAALADAVFVGGDRVGRFGLETRFGKFVGLAAGYTRDLARANESSGSGALSLGVRRWQVTVSQDLIGSYVDTRTSVQICWGR
jgi:hypothetical protein